MSRLTVLDVTDGQALPELVVAVTPRTVIMGASSSRDWQPQHHDHDWAINRAGTRDIFLNTPNQAGWIERFITDWTGPRGRLGRLKFRMRKPVCPGDELRFSGTVTGVDGGWVDIDIALTVGDTTVTQCTARVAVPTDEQDNPWSLRGDDWRP